MVSAFGMLSTPEAGVAVEALAADVVRGHAHELEDLRVVQRRSRRPDPRGRARDERRREARSGQRGVAARVEGARNRGGDVDSRGCEVDAERRRGEVGGVVELVGRGHREHVGEAAGRTRGDALSPLVPRRRDEDRAGAERPQQRVLEQACVRDAEAHVDHARAGGDRRVERCDHVRDRQTADVDGAEHRLRVDADDADTVLRGGRDRRDRGAMEVLTRLGQVLRAEQDRVRAPRELLVGDVEPGVDHGDRLPGARRRRSVGPDERAPVLVLDQGVDGGAEELDRQVRLDGLHHAAREQPGEDSLGSARREEPDPLGRGDERAALRGQRASLELHECPRIAADREQTGRARVAARPPGPRVPRA